MHIRSTEISLRLVDEAEVTVRVTLTRGSAVVIHRIITLLLILTVAHQFTPGSDDL